MLTQAATPEMVAAWKRLYAIHRPHMTPNRKTGAEVDAYFRAKYPCRPVDDAAFREVCEANIMEQEWQRQKLPERCLPDIRCYGVDGVLVGIDVISGAMHVECEAVEKAAPIYDDLFAFRGLDAADLDNFFLVAQYVACTAKGRS